MTRRSEAEYDWDNLTFDETIIPIEWSRYTSPRQLTIQFVVVHHMTVLGNGSGSALDACYNIWKDREASAQYGVDGSLVRQFVWDGDAAWATADYVGNNAGVSIEHANAATGDASGWPVAELTWKTGAKLAAYLHVFYGLGRPWSNSNGTDGTLRVHQSFFATGCPGPWMMNNWKNYVAEAARVFDQITNGEVPVAPSPAPIQPAPQKTITQLANEVIAGVYGSGDDRRAALGDLYDQVQAEVNRILLGTPSPAPVQSGPDINALANAVIRGEYGSGDDRRNRLGALYDQVQAEVNRILSGAGTVVPAGPTITDIAWQVINGQWGNGDDRMNRLWGAGYDANAVQAEVNRLLG